MSASKELKRTVLLKKKVLWKLPNFSKDFFAKDNSGEAIQSKEFTVSRGDVSTKWSLSLFPNGESEKAKSYVSVYLKDESDDDSVNYVVKFNFGVAKKDRKNDYVREETTEHSIEEMKGGIGIRKFLSHADLFDESKGFVVDGSLTVFVDLKIEFDVETEKPELQVPINLRMIDKYKEMLGINAWSDFKLKTELKTSDGEVSLKAHIVVIQFNSKVFYSSTTIDLEKEHEPSDFLPDFLMKIARQTFFRFLFFHLYYNEVENLEDLAFDLVYVAEKYQIKELKELCLQQIAAKLRVENVIKALMIASKVSEADGLFNACSDLIFSYFDEVVKRPEWQEVPTSLFTRLMKKSLDNCDILNI